MANAESPDPSTDLVPVTNNEEEVDPVAPAPDPKLPTRKDASLKEFLSKMDDYAPIVNLLTSRHSYHPLTLLDS
jgi:transcription initiation factor TFIID subunit 10